MFTNAEQSREEYKTKYAFVRDAGFPVAVAKRLASWRYRYIINYLYLNIDVTTKRRSRYK